MEADKRRNKALTVLKLTIRLLVAVTINAGIVYSTAHVERSLIH